MRGMKTFYGHVREPLDQFFSYAPDGKLEFKPFNDSYAAVHPDAGPGTGENDVEFVLNDGEYFQVWDRNNGYVGYAVNFLDYWDAYRKARTCGEYGGIARISICHPDGTENVTALDADGNKVIMDTRTRWGSIDVHRRARFLNRPDRPADTSPQDV